MIGIMVFSIERIVVYSLRLVQTREESKRLGGGQANYQQTSFGMGYIGLTTDILQLFRCLIVNPTYGTALFHESAAYATKDCHIAPPREGDPDHPKQRSWARRFCGVVLILCLTAIALGIVGNANYSGTFNNESNANRTYLFRYISGSIITAILITLGAGITWSLMKQPRAGKRGILTLAAVIALLTGIASYRLVVMRHRTDALDSMEPSSQNTTRAKILFYVLHAAPEWLVSALLLSINTRKTFGTGPFGDWRSHDETPAEREKRLKWEAKRAAKKEAKAAEKA